MNTPIIFATRVLPRLGLTMSDIIGESRVSEVYYARLMYGHLLFCAGISDIGVASLLGITRPTAYYYPDKFIKELQWNKSFQEFVAGVDMMLNDVK